MTDLGFDLHLSGRAPKALGAEVVRELTQSDLALLATERGVQPSHVQRITNRHHALARCLASGMSATEAGLVTGYTGSRISVLRGDPAFEELIAFYQGEKGLPVQDLQDKMTALAADTITELQERLETNPESFAVGELHDQFKLVADRSGFGPKATNVNVNVNLGDRMRTARERAASVPSSRTTSARSLGPALSHEGAGPTISGSTESETYSVVENNLVLATPSSVNRLNGSGRVATAPDTIEGEYTEVQPQRKAQP